MRDEKYVRYTLVKTKAFEICYTTIETAHMDSSKWTEEQKACNKAFICTLHVQTFAHSDVNKEPLIALLALTSQCDTILECYDWANKQWETRKMQDWYKDYCSILKERLKERYHSLIER